MKKLVKGIAEFRSTLQPQLREKFSKLALGQKPDALYIGCSDSRVAVNVFASTDPGDLFVVRNVGNMVPPSDAQGLSTGDESEAAAIEFALENLNVRNIIVCGHSECGAMHALIRGRDNVSAPNLKSWLRHGADAASELHKRPEFAPGHAEHNRLSKLNVLLQIEHLKTYPVVQNRIKEGTLELHGWWFDIANADVFAYEPQLEQFVLFDEEEVARILKRIHEEG